MQFRYRFAVGAALAGAFFAASSSADDLESVQKRIVDLSDKVKAYSADMKMVIDLNTGGVVRTQDAEGRIEFQRKGDKYLSRAQIKLKMVQIADGKEEKTEQSILQVSDGEFMFFLQEPAAGPKQAFKMKADKAQSNIADKEMFDDLRKTNELKLMPEQQFDGKDVFVIEATPKQADPMGPAKSTFFFSKEFGMLVRQVAASADGKPIQTLTFSNLKIDPEIAADRFVFAAPEGVEVTDMTKQGNPQPDQP